MGRLWTFTVEKAFNITPNMRRVRFVGDELAGWAHKPGQEIILRLPQPNGEIVRRHYTVRQVGANRSYMDVDFVLHGEGPATAWVLGAKPGDSIDLTGPRGRVVLNTDADWHLFSGDETCIPAIFSMIEALPASARAFAFIEVGGAEDEQELKAAAKVQLEWLHRKGNPPGPSRILADRLDAFVFPEGRGHAYIIGETTNARTQRQALIARGFPKKEISAEGYWRPGRIGGHDHVDDEH
jgi:NADPH-dependent ferric siderophore reductase